MAATLSHAPFHTARAPRCCHHTAPQSRRDKKAQRTVRFASSTTDIVSALALRHQQLRFPPYTKPRPPVHCKPILKDSAGNMTEYLRSVGKAFGQALHAFGVWCTGVTSKNPNVRCDMYKQLIAQIRGSSLQMQMAAWTVLQNHVHGIWVQLLDDFSMLREEYSENEFHLYTWLLDDVLI
jgi:hypothetical protein